MIWIELAACVIIAIECLFYLLYIIPPSFHFFMSICTLRFHLSRPVCRSSADTLTLQ